MDSSPFFRPDAALVAVDDDDLVGVIVGTVRGGDQGRIPLFFVSSQRADSRSADTLLHRVLAVFRDAGMSHVEAGTSWETGLSDCGYDTRYEDIVGVLSRNGFRRVWSDDELDVDLLKDLRVFAPPPWVAEARAGLVREGFSFAACTPELRQRYLVFMLEHFGGYGGWCTRAKEYVESGRESGFRMLAFQGGDIVGFTECVFGAEGEPPGDWYVYATGVRTDLRRKKIGSVLVYESLAEIKERGGDRVCIGEAPLNFYRVVEGTVLRRYMVMRQELEMANDGPETTRANRASEA